MDKKTDYRMDKTAFSVQTLREANNHYGFWKDRTQSERLNAAFYLIAHAYKTSVETRLDRKAFSKRKHG